MEATSASLKRSHAPRKQKGRQKRLERTPSSGPESAPPRETSFTLEPEPKVDIPVTNMAQESLSSASESLDSPFLLSDDCCSHFLEQFSTFSSEETSESFLFLRLVTARLELVSLYIYAFDVFLDVASTFFGMRDAGLPTKNFTIDRTRAKITLYMAR